MNEKMRKAFENVDTGILTNPEDYGDEEFGDKLCDLFKAYFDSLDESDFEENPAGVKNLERAYEFLARQAREQGIPVEELKIAPKETTQSLGIKMKKFVIDDSNRQEFLEILTTACVFGIDHMISDTIDDAQKFFWVMLNIEDVLLHKRA